MNLCQGEGRALKLSAPMLSVVHVKLLDDTFHFMGGNNPAIDEETADAGL